MPKSSLIRLLIRNLNSSSFWTIKGARVRSCQDQRFNQFNLQRLYNLLDHKIKYKIKSEELKFDFLTY